MMRFVFVLAGWGALAAALVAAEKRTVVLDADTANEVDDLYAIVRAFAEPSWDIVALNATQWQVSQWSAAESMEESHRLNTVLHSYLKLGDATRLNRGGYRRMYDWGNKAVHSAAANEIIRLANDQDEGEKLTVIALGALTNVASAMYIDPGIEDKLELYWLGTTYDRASGAIRTLDFNAIMDPQAVGLLLESKMTMHVLPVSELGSYQFEFQRTREELESRHELGAFLVDHWFRHHDSGRYQRILWDVALIQAMLYPERVKEIAPEAANNPNLTLYVDLDTAFFVEEMYESLKQTLDSL